MRTMTTILAGTAVALALLGGTATLQGATATHDSSSHVLAGKGP